MLFLAHLIGFSLAAICCLGAAAWVRRRAAGRAASALVILLGLEAVWTMTVVGQLLATSFEGMLVWGLASFLCYLAAPIVGFVFAVYYAGREYWLTPPVRVALAATYVVPVAISLSQPIHGYGWGELGRATEPFSYLTFDPNLSFLLLLGVMYAYTAVAVALIGQLMIFAPRIHRAQIGAVLIGVVATVATGLLSWSNVVPVPGLDYSPIGVAIFSITVSWGLYRKQLFPVLPLARQTVLDAIDDAVIVVDESGTIADYNAAASSLVADLDGGIGRPLVDVCPGLLADTGPDSADGSQFAESVTFATPEGTRSCRVTVSELRRRDTLFGYSLIVRDVTDVEAHVVELERKTTQLERFASTVSHDLRNPLSVARGYVELARETDDVELLDHATGAHDRMEETIEDLLTLARRGENVQDRYPVSLADVARDAWETSETGNATLVCELDSAHRVEADPARLQGLFENLFRNSVEHGSTSSRAEPDDSVEHGSTGSQNGARSDDSVEHGSTSSRAEPDDSVEHGSTSSRPGADGAIENGDTEVAVRIGRHDDGFFVEDDGPGVPESERSRIFDYGYTTDAAGTGLGLATVESIAAAHGWEVAVESASSGGARFLFSGVRFSAP